ncbi:MAG: ABC transporter ATP-binding protein [Candidatus Woesearchaeota archaeon]
MKSKKTKVVIKLENVWKIYDFGNSKVEVLKGLNLEVKKGEFLVIMGPSGAGKSTTMNMIGCLDVPTHGKIYLDGIDISKLSDSELARLRGKKIGFVFQQFNLIQSLNALENVMLPMMFQNIPKEERIRRAKELLERVGLGKRIYHKPRQLSGGEQQRVAIARALSNDPEFILADEPTGNLDTKSGAAIINLLKELHNDGKTIILVTHDARLTEHANRVVYLIDGKFVDRETFNKYKF